MKKIGIIGFGNMGQAMAQRLKANYAVGAFDKDATKLESTGDLVKKILNLALLIQDSEIVIIAVKPQDFSAVLETIQRVSFSTDKLLISIAAGITTGYVEKFLGSVRVIRAMPNVGAKIGKSVTCICKGSFATNQDLEMAKEIFTDIGEVQELSEDMMNAATAISGSGPAYYFRAIETNPDEYKNNHKKFHEEFISSLSKAARDIGFDEKVAQFLAHWTVVYSDLLLKQTGLAPEELRRQVTSKGGTTEAALEILHSGGTLVDAVKAAVERAKTLSRG